MPLRQVAATMLTRCDLLPEGIDGNPEASYTYNPPDRKLPEALEAAAYYVVAEALANVQKHAGAGIVVVTAACG